MPDYTNRAPTAVEKGLLRRLLSQRLPTEAYGENLDSCRVRTIDDCGSLAICGFDVALPAHSRRPEVESSDEDGVAVYGLLHVDQEGRPVELELVKADGSRLVRPLDTLEWISPEQGWPPGWV